MTRVRSHVVVAHSNATTCCIRFSSRAQRIVKKSSLHFSRAIPFLLLLFRFVFFLRSGFFFSSRRARFIWARRVRDPRSRRQNPPHDRVRFRKPTVDRVRERAPPPFSLPSQRLEKVTVIQRGGWKESEFERESREYFSDVIVFIIYKRFRLSCFILFAQLNDLHTRLILPILHTPFPAAILRSAARRVIRAGERNRSVNFFFNTGVKLIASSTFNISQERDEDLFCHPPWHRPFGDLEESFDSHSFSLHLSMVVNTLLYT